MQYFVLPLAAAIHFIESKTKERLCTFILLQRQAVQCWLAALKRENSPVSRDTTVCSKLFVSKDYQEKRVFQSGVLVVRLTDTLKSQAARSVFDISSKK